MKRNKIRNILFILLFVIFLIPLASCNSSNGARADNNVTNNSSSIVYDANGRKITYRVSYNYKSNDIKTTIKDIRTHILEVSGYISHSYEGDTYARYEYKVPTAKLNEIAEYIDSQNGFFGKTVDTSDITSSYDSVTAAINRLEARKKIYQEAIDNDASLTTQDKLRYIDLIEEIDMQLEKYYNEKDQMDSTIDYSTLTIYYNIDNSGDWAKVLGNVVVGSLAFVGISLLIASPFLVAGLVVFLVLRKKKNKEIE